VGFEFDPDKSASNLEKHGIDFTAVQALWEDALRVEVPARRVDEPRWLVIGQIAGKHWSVVVTHREQWVRIISARRSRKERRRSVKAEEFDQKFDNGEDVTSDLDLAAIRRPGLEQRRVNVEFPLWMIESLDREARRLGVTRQSIIKAWIAERPERAAYGSTTRCGS
jgi:uncharacterized DUF497 family protein